MIIDLYNKKYLWLFAPLLLLITLLYFYVDKTIAEYFIAHADRYRNIGKTISISGQSHWYMITGLLGWLFYKYKKENLLLANRFLFLLYANIFSGLLSIFFKYIFGRVRPWGLRGERDDYGFLLFQNFDLGFFEKFKLHIMTIVHAPTTYSSFPSGHTTTLFTVFTVLTLFFPKQIYIWLTLATIGALARVIAADHFVSDIVAGATLGVLSTLFLYKKMQSKI